MENFSADFDSSSILDGNYGNFMDELMLPNFIADDEFLTSLPTIEYIDPAILTTISNSNDNIAYGITLENVFETNGIYQNDHAINISEDQSPNLYLNDMIIDNNNIILTSNNNNNHYNNNNNTMMVSEDINHINESIQVSSSNIGSPTLKPLRITALKDECNHNNITNLATPDIANQIFELESNKMPLADEPTELEYFDLIEYINSPNETMTSFDEDLQEEPATPIKMTTKRKYSEYQETSSACSSIGSPAPSSSSPKKRRGRPPKPLDEITEIPDVDNLNDSDIKYLEMRNKNNLASRRSRMNRKHREIKDESEASKLEEAYSKLIEQERKLIKDCDKWRRAVMRLAAM